MGFLSRFMRGFGKKKIQKIDGSASSISSLGFIDGFLTGRLGHDGAISILQCGANDGVTVDPLRDFILRNPTAVQAVLIEPLPDVFADLSANYSDRENVEPLNVAIGPEKTIELYRIKPEYTAQYKGVIASGVTSFDREFVLRKARNQLDVKGVSPEDRVECFTQKCCTVSQIVDDYPGRLGHSLFVQIDAEGFDDQVVYTIDFDRHQPFAINYEMENLSAERHAKLRSYLSERGYVFVRWCKSDEIAIRK